ncbi:flavocytochrome c [Serpentinicella alkaliphila]|uniref:Fumarate reductase flavoprotein subunit n=1 Tax=Serpentinicella alkaliphila TaxID=1734049 RepID=A0A4R2TGR0_9FIRM|nr:flavocytochrome c [Serpentinicella alkaliphila]QUH24627.1 flavocytochrome c [Serpentinicella alkaliphila]TCQ02628.1 fumarate reductase flavoprotein subunit [Serpentinicella alkaliphila]
MKKKSVLLISLILVFSLIVVGCSSNKQPASNKPEVSNSADVLVNGGGGAGLVSAITAAENGAKVILVEKMPMIGGNTIISATGLTASDTELHEEAGVPFTVEDHIKRTMETGNNLPDENLVRILAENSNEAYEWLVSLGLSYKLNEKEPWWIIPSEGHFGSLLVGAYQKEAQRLGVDVRVNTTATELVVEDGIVVGAKVVDKDGNESVIEAKSVILATGGFGNATDLIGEYNPKYANAHNVMSTAGPTGDGFRMAVELGAGTRDMEFHQMRPLATPGYWIRESVINAEGGGVLLNKDGVRFTNETLKPLDLVPQVLAQKDRVGYVIFDSEVAETSNGKAAIEKGRMIQAETIEELAQKLELDPAVVVESIKSFNDGVDEFGRGTVGKVTVGPFYGVEVRPSSHYTMAGITINENAQVTDTNGVAIPGLYAAGEIVGGLYGSGRVAGNNTTENIVFGKIAGRNAALK